jgi:hypothetical protein
MTSRRNLISGLAPVAAAGFMAGGSLESAPSASTTAWPIFNVRDFGAEGNGSTMDTAAVQAAIDTCSKKGGGTVFFPEGKYLCATIMLRDFVTLHLSVNAAVLGSQNESDYPMIPSDARDLDQKIYGIWALIYAEKITGAGIEGRGFISGQGKPFKSGRTRPRMIYMRDCKNIRLHDITLRDSAFWTCHLAKCSDVMIHGITIDSWTNFNNDGIDVDSCQNVIISDCNLNTEDDCISLKAAWPGVPLKNVVIDNCMMKSTCGAVKIGTASIGDFLNVSVTNCAVYDMDQPPLKLMSVDGGALENFTFSNITMDNVAAPIFVRLGNRAYDFGLKDLKKPLPVAKVRNILFNNIRATITKNQICRRRACKPELTMNMTGIPGHPIEGVVIQNLHVTIPGVGTLDEARRRDIPDPVDSYPGGYPNEFMFGVLPCYGMFVRHAKGIVLRDIRFEVDGQDMRSAVLCDDVEDLEISGLRAPVLGSEPLIRLVHTRDAFISGCRPTGNIANFLRVEGDRSAGIGLTGNDLRGVAKAISVAGGAIDRSVQQAGNLTA